MRHPVGVSGDIVGRVARNLLAGTPLDTRDIDLLLDLATRGSPADALAGSKRLFREIVEPLADRFDPELSPRYSSFFAALLDRVRLREGFERFNERLLQSLAGADSEVGWPDEVRRCLVLSRVTLGADVAVTSVVLDGLKRAYPDAQLSLACGAKAAELFAGDDRVSILPVEYARTGSLASRLGTWVALCEQVDEWAGNGPRDALIVDPDSRLTQLGMLPLTPPSGHHVTYDSRQYGGDGPQSISEQTSWWVREMFAAEGAKPYIALSDQDLQVGRRFRGDSARPVATLNWGFGGNDTKRVSAEFETAVVMELLGRGWRVVLDKGFGEVEREAANATARVAEAAGLDGLELYGGSLSGFAGVIAASDLFVGYDSAAGHIATALGIPGIDVFRGAVSPRMLQRWSPWGAAPANVVEVSPDETPQQTLARVVELLP